MYVAKALTSDCEHVLQTHEGSMQTNYITMDCQLVIQFRGPEDDSGYRNLLFFAFRLDLRV